MTAAVKLGTWSVHAGIGLHCDNQGLGACDFTVVCRGLASNPTTTPSPRDVLKLGPSRYRFRYFHCVLTSPCFLNGSWWQDYQTRTAAAQNLANDARRVGALTGAELRTNPAGC